MAGKYQVAFPKEKMILPRTEEFNLLKAEYIDKHFSDYIQNFEDIRYRNEDKHIKVILSIFITELYEKLLVESDEYVPVNNFSWFEQITQADMQYIINFLYDIKLADSARWHLFLSPAIKCIKHVQRNPSILQSYVLHDKRPDWIKNLETHRPPFGRGSSVRSEFRPPAPAFGRGSSARTQFTPQA